MKKTLIKCNDISLGYENMTVLEHVSFELNEGDYLCVVGENGAGKSTLIKCLAGLKKPVSGQIILSPEISRGDVGYLPQQTAIQRDFPASVREVVTSGCLNKSRIIPFSIARALLSHAGVLLCDEITSALDVTTQAQVVKLLMEIRDMEQVSVIMVSHDVKTAVKSANKILHLKHSVLFFGSTAEYIRSSAGREFIGG